MSISARILALAVAVMVVVPAAAQAQMSPMSIGVKAGLNLASVSSESDEEIERKTGLVAGLFVSREVNPNFGLQLEGLYSMRGAKFSEDGGDAKINLNFIDIPLLARLGSQSANGTKYYVITGPQVGIKVKGEIDFDGVTVDLEDDVKSTDFGWVIGAGADMNRFTVDARFTLGLSNLSSVSDEGSVKNRTFAVMVGYRLK